MHVQSRQQYLPQNPSTLDVFLNKDDTEQGNLKICHQYLPCRPFYTFYFHHRLAHMRHLDVSSSATKGMTGNGWTFYHDHEGHGSVC